MNDKDFDYYFKNHVATQEVFAKVFPVTSVNPAGTPTVDKLIWEQPGTNINRIIYLLHGRLLFVAGDLGEAVFQFGSQGSFREMANCSIDYFSKKCLASENGRGYLDWDAEVAKETMKNWFDEYEKEYREEDLADGKKPRKDLESDFDWRDGWEALGSKEEWEAWLDENGRDFLGDYFYEDSRVVEAGRIYSTRLELMLEGLKRAVAQLEAAQQPQVGAE